MRSPTLVLAGHSLTRLRTLVLGMGLLLGVFQVLLAQAAVYLQRTAAFGSMFALVPDFVRSAAGPSVVSLLSFSGVVAIGYFHPFVLAALLGLTIAIATEPVADVETRFTDLTAARPVSRAALVLHALVVLAAAGAIVLALMAAGTWVGVAAGVPAPLAHEARRMVPRLAIELAATIACWGGLTLAAGCRARRRATAGGVAGVLVLAAFLLDYLSRVWAPARAISWVSPFHYFDPFAAATGAPWSARNLAVLLGLAVVGSGIALAGFGRRDL